MVKPQTSGPDLFLYITIPWASGFNILPSKTVSIATTSKNVFSEIWE